MERNGHAELRRDQGKVPNLPWQGGDGLAPKLALGGTGLPINPFRGLYREDLMLIFQILHDRFGP